MIVVNLGISLRLVLNRQKIQECHYREKFSSVRHSLRLTEQKRNRRVTSHLITSAVVWDLAISGSHTLKAIIDSGSPFNLIFQMKVKEMQLTGGNQPNQKPRGIDGNPLRTYFEHKLEVFTTDLAKQIVCNIVVFLGADIGGFDIMLGRP